MKLKRWVLVLAFLGFGLFTGVKQGVSAATGAQYTVSPVIPRNQRTGASNYFDLIVKKGTTQPISVNVTNRSNVQRKLKVALTTAYSQSNGVVAYKPNGPKDSSAQYRLNELGIKPYTLTLKGGATQKATLRVKIPKGGFKGVLLGSVYITDTTPTKDTSSDSMHITNRFATVVGVQLQTSANAIDQVPPHLRLQKVTTGIQNGAPAVIATVQNDRPTYWGKMTWSGRITRRGSDKVVMKRTVHNYAVAPNSHLDYGIFSDKALEPGDYTLNLTVSGPNGKWHWQQNFSILAATADKINRKLNLKTSFVMPWWGWLLICLGVLIIILIVLLIVLLWRRKKPDESQVSE